MSTVSNTPRYPLLEEMLALRGMLLQATYNNRDLGTLFGVSCRSIQDWSASGRINARDLPGRARFLPADIEEFLRNSRRPQKK
jgi:hypothetical protein